MTDRLNFCEMSRAEHARLARLWAVEHRSFVGLTRMLGAPDRDAWQIRCAIECFCFDQDADRYDALLRTPHESIATYRQALRRLTLELLASE